MKHINNYINKYILIYRILRGQIKELQCIQLRYEKCFFDQTVLYETSKLNKVLLSINTSINNPPQRCQHTSTYQRFYGGWGCMTRVNNTMQLACFPFYFKAPSQTIQHKYKWERTQSSCKHITKHPHVCNWCIVYFKLNKLTQVTTISSFNKPATTFISKQFSGNSIKQKALPCLCYMRNKALSLDANGFWICSFLYYYI